MIKEAYCSYEVAKLLKEKGFDEPCTELNKLCIKDDEKPVLKITQQKAMKWLREVHNIVIVVTPSMFWGKYNVSVYKGNDYPIGFDGDSFISSYEQACEEALKYTLKNLI